MNDAAGVPLEEPTDSEARSVMEGVTRFVKRQSDSNLPPRLVGENAESEVLQHGRKWGPLQAWFGEQDFGWVIYVVDGFSSVRVRASEKGQRLLVDVFEGGSLAAEVHIWKEEAPATAAAWQRALKDEVSDG